MKVMAAEDQFGLLLRACPFFLKRCSKLMAMAAFEVHLSVGIETSCLQTSNCSFRRARSQGLDLLTRGESFQCVFLGSSLIAKLTLIKREQ